MSNKVLRYSIIAIDKGRDVIAGIASRVGNLAATIRKSLGGIGQWAMREMDGLANAPQMAAVALLLAAAAGRVWHSVVKSLMDQAKAAKGLLASIITENLDNAIIRQAKAYDRLRESIERTAAAAEALSQAQKSKANAAVDVATSGLEADKAEALAALPADDKAGRARVGAEFDAKIKQVELDGKSAAAARDVADAERKAAENAERRQAAQERIEQLAKSMTEENKRLAAASDTYSREGNGIGDRARGTLAAITGMDAGKGVESRFRDKNEAKARMDESTGRLDKMAKELNEARKEKEDADAVAAALQTDVETAKLGQNSVANERRRLAATPLPDAAAVASAAAGDESLRERAAAAKEEAKALEDLADNYAETAARLADKAAALQEFWGGIGQGGPGGAAAFAGFQGERIAREQQGKEDAKFEKALKRAQDKEDRLNGRGRVSKKDQELLDFAKKRDDELGKAAKMRNDAERAKLDEIAARNKTNTLLGEVKDLLKKATTMDGGNGGGPE